MAWRVSVLGRVQGVGFRWYCQRAASACGVQGWVRNEQDGSVQLFVQGEESQAMAFLQRVKKGPPGSCVDECRVEVVEDSPTAVAFQILR
ncbi:MAG: acylphosphatase [Acidobacteria bacterium]|nr:acylphosphatase [Acidobacteriota bacterium]MCB9398162.1 acylphosphatase [Acidobacteriota bacterium]